jgi:GntR family transcriptional repressor for pyruvate dehydrogenase complex
MVSERMPPINSLAPVQSRKLADQVLEQLRQWLEHNELPVGSKLPTEPQLMELFKVGRSTIREAVKALVYAGILEVRPGDGTYIKAHAGEIESFAATLKRSDVVEVFEVRRTFETAVARLASLNRSEADLKKIAKLIRACKDDVGRKDFAAFLDHDYDFHVAVAAAGKNRLLAELYGSFRRVLKDSIGDALENSQLRLQAVLDIHDNLYAAIRDRDPDRAQAVWLLTRNPFEAQPSPRSGRTVRPSR